MINGVSGNGPIYRSGYQNEYSRDEQSRAKRNYVVAIKPAKPVDLKKQFKDYMQDSYEQKEKEKVR